METFSELHITSFPVTYLAETGALMLHKISRGVLGGLKLDPLAILILSVTW